MSVKAVDSVESILGLLKMLNSVRIDELCDCGCQGFHTTLEIVIEKSERLAEMIKAGC